MVNYKLSHNSIARNFLSFIQSLILTITKILFINFINQPLIYIFLKKKKKIKKLKTLISIIIIF